MINEMVHRTMAAETRVRVKAHEIDVRAIPYNTPATVYDPGVGVYREQIHPDAFAIEKRRPNQVKLLRDHDVQRIIGSCTKVNPRPADGLHATARVNKGVQLALDSLALAEEGDLHVSVGFIPDPAFDVWDDNHELVTRHSCTLWEISLVPFPAYEGAEVLAVRSAPAGIERVADIEPVPVAVPGSMSATPNLDEVMAWLTARSLQTQ